MSRAAVVGLGLLVPAPLAFATHAALLAAGRDGLPGPTFAVVGVLGAAGMLTLIAATWRTDLLWRIVMAALVTFLGHYVVDPFIDPDLGAAMVYLGTGLAGSVWWRPVAYAGLAAAGGALLRSAPDPTPGQILLAVGAAGLGVMLALAAGRAARDPTPATTG